MTASARESCLSESTLPLEKAVRGALRTCWNSAPNLGSASIRCLRSIIEDEVVSSTRIRQLIQSGDLRKAIRFLGRPYSIEGTVISGAHRGTEFGWPTANLRLPAGRVIPPDGVYAAQVVWNHRLLDSVVYIGTRPTFGAGERLLEVSILDERLDLYGESIRVQLLNFLREDKVFASAEDLTRQIAVDVEMARAQLREAVTAIPLSTTATPGMSHEGFPDSLPSPAP